jgi:hypothetical protein
MKSILDKNAKGEGGRFYQQPVRNMKLLTKNTFQMILVINTKSYKM